jgi:diguanylate cyclase (GGDEF)-like protein
VLLYVDLDRFKLVNDSFGHAVGDEILTLAGRRMERALRVDDLLARHGGDEFLILISSHEEEALRRATVLQQAFAASATVADLPAGVGLSIGCVEVPAETTDIMPFVQTADEQMYLNKKRRSKRPS